MNHALATQELDHRIWSIVRLFYLSLLHFREQREGYEEKVLARARAEGINREVLRLRSRELAELLDFKSLERLRDRYIYELKELCHLVFRSRDHTDPLDRYVSDIFHEISILKEEHYTVKTYAPLYEDEKDEVELRYILDEAHVLFPQKLRQIEYLFDRARERMEQHLPSFRTMPILTRSLFLARDDFVRAVYPEGIEDFYRIMYPWGPFEGYYTVGLSFYHAGFFEQAKPAFELALDAYPRSVDLEKVAAASDPSNPPGVWLVRHKRDRRDLHAMRRSLEAKLLRLEREEARARAEEAAAPPEAQGAFADRGVSSTADAS